MPTYTGLNSAMFRVAVIDGGAAASDLAVDGLAPGDQLLMVLHQNGAGLLAGDLRGEASVPATGTLTLGSTATTDGKLVVVWLDVDQPEV